MTREQMLELARYTAAVIRARDSYRTSEHGERRCEFCAKWSVTTSRWCTTHRDARQRR